MRRILTIALPLLLALPAPYARALPTGVGDFHDLVQRADLIFAGTVADAQCTRVRDGIITEITFRRLVYVKGSGPKDSLIVRRDGGTLDGMVTGSEDQPTFCVGERCVLLARSDLGSSANLYTPFVGASAGVFRLFEDSPKKKPVVHDSHGTPVAGIEDRRLLLAVDENAGRRLSEKEFLETLRRIVREQEKPAPPR